MTSHSDWKTIPNHIRSYRRKRGLRLWDVAHLIGLQAVPHLSQWESGKRTPNLENALKLSAALKCPVEVLFCDHFRIIRKEVSARQQKYRIKLKY